MSQGHQLVTTICDGAGVVAWHAGANGRYQVTVLKEGYMPATSTFHLACELASCEVRLSDVLSKDLGHGVCILVCIIMCIP